MAFLLGFETLALVALKAAFGKAAVGVAVKTGAAVVGKALVVHDVVRVASHFADAATAIDVASTASDVAGPIGGCGGSIPVDPTVISSAPVDIPPTASGLVIDPAPGIGECGSVQTAALTLPVDQVGTGVDADKTIWGTDPGNNAHGNPPTNIQGNPTDTNIHGKRPGDIHGPHF